MKYVKSVYSVRLSGVSYHPYYSYGYIRYFHRIYASNLDGTKYHCVGSVGKIPVING